MKPVDSFKLYEDKEAIKNNRPDKFSIVITLLSIPVIIVGLILGSNAYIKQLNQQADRMQKIIQAEHADSLKMATPQKSFGIIIEKHYVPKTAGNRYTDPEKFILLFKNQQGVTYSIDDRKFYALAGPGDSVIVTFNHIKEGEPTSELNIINVK